MMERIPVKNEPIANMEAVSMGIVSKRLLKNVSPPLCPDAIKADNTMKNRMEITINLTDQLPRVVLGL
jgi:hypothetical protein